MKELNKDLTRANLLSDELESKKVILENELLKRKLNLKNRIKGNIQALADYRNGAIESCDISGTFEQIVSDRKELADYQKTQDAIQKTWSEMVELGFIIEK